MEAGQANAFGSIEDAKTSDDLKQRRFNVGAVSDRSDVLWPYSEEKETGTAWGLGYERIDGTGRFLVSDRPSYSIDRPYLLVNHKISALWSVDADLGWFSYAAKDPSHDGSELTGAVRTIWKASDELNMSFKIYRASMLQDLMLINAVTDPTLYNGFTWNAAYTFYQTWKIQQMWDQRWVSDGNSRWMSDTALMYGFSQYPTWFWVGGGMNALGVNERATYYWSPSAVQAYGLRVELTQPVMEDSFIKLGGSLSRLQEEDFDPATANYVRVAVQKGDREKKNVELYFVNIRSERAATRWSQQALGLNVNWPF